MATLSEVAFGKDVAGVRRLLAEGAQPNDPAHSMNGWPAVVMAAGGGCDQCRK